MKRLMIFALAMMCAATASAQSRNRKGARGADGGEAVAKGRDAYCTIDTPARPGGTCLASAPNLQATGKLLPPIGGKPRAIIMDTIKGKGIKDVEETVNNHSMNMPTETYDKWLAELKAELAAME